MTQDELKSGWLGSIRIREAGTIVGVGTGPPHLTLLMHWQP